MKIGDLFSIKYVHGVPRYRKHSEIGKFLKEVEKQNKGVSKLEIIGQSLEGRDIYCLEVGNNKSKNKVLMLANAHGEELRGCEELLHLIKALTENYYLKSSFLSDYHFTIIPTINPDAREYNLRWAKKEINLEEFFLTAKRTIEDEKGIEADIEWGYPLNDDDKRKIRRPETAALRQLMDSQRFDLFLDLHGALNGYDIGFWYLVGDGKRKREEVIEFLYSSGKRSGLPLIELEKMEDDSCFKLKPGVHTLCTAKQILKKFENNKKLVEWFKKERGASSFDYLMNKNPDSQGIIAELPTFYHEKYMDMTPSGRLRADVKRERIEYSIKLWKEEIAPLTEKALEISQHPKLKKFRKDIDDVKIEYLKQKISQLEEEHGLSKATLGEIRDLADLYKYWLCPGYGRGGLGGIISKLPEEEKKNLKNVYKTCQKKARGCVKKVEEAKLRELSFEDSINLQSKACLGTILIYFR